MNIDYDRYISNLNDLFKTKQINEMANALKKYIEKESK